MTKVTAQRVLTGAFAMSALALVAPSTRAQVVASAAPATGAALQEVVVTAQFRVEKLQETPLAITAISGDALAARNITSLQDVTQAAPNVQLFENNAAY